MNDQIEMDNAVALYINELYNAVPNDEHNLWEDYTISIYNAVMGMYVTHLDSITHPHRSIRAEIDMIENGKIFPVPTKEELSTRIEKNQQALYVFIALMRSTLERHRWNFIKTMGDAE